MIMMICGAALIAAVSVAVGSIFRVMGDTYENAKEYSQSDADIADTVKNLDIHWTAGKVRIAYHSDQTVLLRETSKKSVSPDMEMRWWLDGDTLRVQYAKSGFRFAFLQPKKELTVTLPENISLKNVGISVTSADMEIPSLKAEDLKLSAVSGDISADADVKTAGMTVTSGDIQFSSRECEDTQISCTSGNIRVDLAALKSLQVDATSGDVTASLPDSPGFTADLNTTSGDINTSLAMTRQGSVYVCGDGSGKVEIHTVSGDIGIN